MKVISGLRRDDVYDLIFVVMKYNDFPAVLPALADNGSKNIVLVGNNGDTLRDAAVLQGEQPDSAEYCVWLPD
ncbi:hypothetical protein ACFTAO_21305 [Paenibacillus rhizoplanae]